MITAEFIGICAIVIFILATITTLLLDTVGRKKQRREFLIGMRDLYQSFADESEQMAQEQKGVNAGMYRIFDDVREVQQGIADQFDEQLKELGRK